MSRSAAASALPLVLAVALLAPVRAGAQLLVYEPFDYPAATILDGTPATGANLTGLYTGTMVPPGFDLRVDTAGLGYGNLVGAPAPAGNRLNQGMGTTAASATASLAQAVPVSPDSALFFSALFTFDDSLNGNQPFAVPATTSSTSCGSATRTRW
jgi:hypothetical protein